ncbi:hypothetical protein LCGC14_2144520 [marine sediment metagenome]|uniref:Uncharacterized protein n=1 Tax=marine sediment metagenome TaxID=412755 RepID=A0A0F9GTQ6_9ZZZZ
MAKEFIPTIRKRVSGAERAKEKRVDVRWLEPEIPMEGVAPSHPKGIIQSHRESIANILVRKGLVEIVEIPLLRVVKAKAKGKSKANATGQEAAEAEAEAARQANQG